MIIYLIKKSLPILFVIVDDCSCHPLTILSEDSRHLAISNTWLESIGMEAKIDA